MPDRDIDRPRQRFLDEIAGRRLVPDMAEAILDDRDRLVRAGLRDLEVGAFGRLPRESEQPAQVAT